MSIQSWRYRNVISMMFFTVIAVIFCSGFPLAEMTLSIRETLLKVKCLWQKCNRDQTSIPVLVKVWTRKQTHGHLLRQLQL